jgi:hypothetical protein
MAKKTKNSSFRDTLGRMSAWFTGSDRFNRGLNGVLAALVAVGMVGGGIFGLKYLESYVNRLAIFTNSEVSVCLYNQPKWMSESLAREILTESFKPIRGQLVQIHHDGQDPQLPRVLALQLAKNAWVDRVTWIRRSFGGQFVINATFREPTALVSLDEWCYLIDDQGYVLPGKYKYDALAGCGMLEIQGVTGPVPATGRLWAGDDLQAGLKLVKLLTPLPFKSQIHSVDVSNFQGRRDKGTPWLTLITDRHTTIRWGKPVGEEHGLETSAAQKLALLATGYERWGYIDFNSQYADVRRSPIQVDVSVAKVNQTEQE